jgi:hypothetical protein
MSHRLKVVLAVSALLCSCGGPEPEAPKAASSPSLQDGATLRASCENVTVAGNLIRVMPTGADDTVNVQCALDLAQGRRGVVVQLARGTFYVRPVFADGLQGEIAGAGMDATVVRNPKEPFPVPPGFINIQDPSRTFPWPYLLTVTGGTVKIRDLTLAGVGWPITSDWGWPPGVQSLAGGAVVQGHADAEFVRVKVVGQQTSDDTFAGYNLYNGIFFEGPTATRASGSFRVHDCVFRDMGSWAPVGYVESARIELADNDVQGLLWGGDYSDLTRSSLMVARNKIRALGPAKVYDYSVGFDASTFVFFANDMVLGESDDGKSLDITATFTGGTRCQVLFNHISAPAPAIHLGPGTSHCFVAGNFGATVLNEGQGNVVIP